MAEINDQLKAKALAAGEVLNRLARVRAVYLFGSHVEGRADKWSDIDVAVFMEGIDGWDMHRRAVAMTEVMFEVGYEVEAHLFRASSLDHPERGSFAEYIIKHGVPVMR